MALDPLSNVVAALERSGIIPDVVPAARSFAPTHLFAVLYPTGTGKEVLLGNLFSKEETADEPVVSFAPMTAAALQDPSYTLAMLDPDVPSRADPENRSFRHWVVRARFLSLCVGSGMERRLLQVTGLRPPAESGSASTTSSSAALKTQPAVTPYRGPDPRPNTDVHRYSACSPVCSPSPVCAHQPSHAAFLLFVEPPAGVQISHDAPEHMNEREQRRKWDVWAFADKYGLKLVGANFLTVRAPDAA